jgi:endoglucanase
MHLCLNEDILFMKSCTKFLFTHLVSSLCLFSILVSIFLSSWIPTEAAQSSYTTSKNLILKDGKTIQLRGVNWFGSETSDKVFHGLWARSYKSMIKQMKNVGFNAIRVPFCPKTLKNEVITSYIDFDKNPGLESLKSLDVIDKIINEINNQGMYFILDHHRPDCKGISELWYNSSYSEADWINDLKFVAKRYSKLANYVGLDLKNEPHGTATWGKNNPKTDWNLAAERAGKEVLAVNPKLLIFVQGIASNGACETVNGHWWGGNLEPLKCKDISTNAIPANKLVLSPHVYGTDISDQPYFNAKDFPKNLPKVWDAHFGFTLDKGKTLVPGEFGGKFGLEGGSSKDKVIQTKLIDYFILRKICNTFYWSWNANSGDTGGILKDDWQNVWTEKVNLLKKLYNDCGNQESLPVSRLKPHPKPIPK